MKKALIICGGIVVAFFAWLFIASASYKPPTFADVKKNCEVNYTLSANQADCEFRASSRLVENK